MFFGDPNFTILIRTGSTVSGTAPAFVHHGCPAEEDLHQQPELQQARKTGENFNNYLPEDGD